MAFEWQELDLAADSLGVDAATLRGWIDSGRAPSRQTNGRCEVLIELLDGGEDGGGDDAGGASAEADAGASTQTNDANSDRAGGNGSPDAAQVDVVTGRELQLAGGMVAAWQRLAESADQELHRSRRLGALAWSTVAVLVVAAL